MDSDEEQALVYRAQGLRDSGAFAELVLVHQSRIRSFLIRLCKNYDMADDLAQDVFLSAYRRLDTFRGSGSFSGWLFKIAYNCFLEQQRKLLRRQQATERYSQSYVVQADKYDGISLDQIDLEQAMVQLNFAEAAAITLCHSFGFSHSEAAGILKAPLGTVKSNVRRGKEKLRRILRSVSMENAT
jgi:RNA polymerase sigma-70 factor (ECF subfamily)